MNQLRKFLQAATATVIILTVGLADARAGDVKSDLPKRKGKYSAKWNGCYGKIVYGEGQRWKTYEGEFLNGVPHGKGARSDGIHHYVGTFKNGYEHGNGVEITRFGDYESKNEGTWISGRQEGLGSETNVDGSRYDGNFESGQKSGQGIEVTKDKDKYVGEFKFGLRHGNGTLIYPSGSRFVCRFKFGKKYGVGRIFDENGIKMLVGQYRGGKLNGFGFQIDENGKKIHEGFYQDSLLVRKEPVDEAILEENFMDIDIEKFAIENPNNLPLCPFKFNGYPDREKKCWFKSSYNCDVSMGEYDRSKRNGLGFDFIETNGGYTIIGEYRDGKINGKGMQISADGKIIKEGIYQLDELVKPEMVDKPIFLKKEYLEVIESTRQLS